MLEEFKEQFWKEFAERKRRELETAIERDEVGDPISAAVAGIFTLKTLGLLAVSVGVSIGTSLLTRALTPRQKLTTGQMSGEAFLQRSGYGVFITEVFGGDPGDGKGGVQIAPIIFYASDIRKHTTTTRAGGGGGKMGPKAPEETTVTYDLDLGLMWCRGPAVSKKILAHTDIIYNTLGSDVTGILDPTVLPDSDYDPGLPPDPKSPYNQQFLRYDGAATVDGTGVRTGVISSGSHANIAIYPGNTTQLPDPTIQAAIDTQHGANSTPAYRRKHYTVLKNFFLTKFSGIVPGFTNVVEHETLKTLDLICADWCSRVGLLSSDYDFTALSGVDVRGMVISGRRYTPAEMMEQAGDVYDVFFTETEGKITGLLKGGASVATIPDTELGWVEDDEAEGEDALQELDTAEPDETKLARRVDVKFIDPDKNWEVNSQGEARQITTGEHEDTVEVQITMTAAEARAVAARRLYNTYIAKPHRFTLSNRYAWLKAGDIITVTRAEGFSHVIQLTAVKGSPSTIQECEGIAQEVATYTQPVTTSGGGVFEVPPVPIPAMTVIGFYDGPLLRDEENTNNNGSGVYAWAQKRTGDGAWNGAGLYVDRGLGEELIAVFDKQATAGRAATVLADDTGTSPFTEYEVTVDLYGTEATLESTDRDGLIAGAGACILGDEVCQILTATRDTSDLVTYPNRWDLVVTVRGQRGTEFATNDHVIDERFVLINDAVKFVPLNLNEVGVTRTYRGVTSGQSLDDAAGLSYTWEGGSRKELAPSGATRLDDSAGNALISIDARERLGFGLHNGVSAFGDRDVKRWEIDIMADATHTGTPLRTLPVWDGMSQSAALISYNASAPTDKFDSVDVNSMSVSGINVKVEGRALQRFNRPGNFIEATLSATGEGEALIGVIASGDTWPLSHTFLYYMRVRSSPTLGNAVFVTDASGTTTVASYTSGAEVRVRMTFSGTEVRSYINWTGPGTPPVHVSAIAPVYPLTPVVRVRDVYNPPTITSGGSASAQKVILTTVGEPKTIYSVAQQIEDFGVVQPTIYANIYSVSPELGRGYPLEVALTDVS